MAWQGATVRRDFAKTKASGQFSVEQSHGETAEENPVGATHLLWVSSHTDRRERGGLTANEPSKVVASKTRKQRQWRSDATPSATPANPPQISLPHSPNISTHFLPL
jgi:hypothetical protein